MDLLEDMLRRNEITKEERKVIQFFGCIVHPALQIAIIMNQHVIYLHPKSVSGGPSVHQALEIHKTRDDMR